MSELDPYKPASDMQSVWLNIGQLQGAMKAQEDRAGRNEGDIAKLGESVNKRFDGVKLHLDNQDAQRAADKAEIMAGQKAIEDAILVAKAQRGVWKWLGGRVEFLVGAGIGFAGAVYGTHK
jgi:hypothetical protein